MSPRDRRRFRVFMVVAALAFAGCGPAVDHGDVKGSLDANRGAASSLDGVAVVEASALEPPSAEAAAATKPRGDGVFVKGDLVFRAATAGLVIGVMEEGGKQVLERGVVYLPDAASDVVVIGDTAFVASGPRGVVVVDVSRVEAPRVLSRISTSGAALRFSLDGDNLLVANGAGGIVLLDVSTPSSPAPKAIWRSSDYVRHAVIRGRDIFVAEGRSGISRLTLDDSGALTHVWRHETKGQARAVSVQGGNLAVADGPMGLLLVDISGEKPVSLGNLPLDDMARDVVFSADGSRTFIASGDDGIIVVDVTNPGSPKASGEFVTDKPTNRLRAIGDRLYVGNDSAGLLILDVSSPDDPAQVYPPVEK